MNIDTRNNIISAFLLIVIVVLAYVLYDAIVSPYQKVQQMKEVTEQVRQRMSNVRDALIKYQNANDNKFPEDLDVLVDFVKADSMMMAKADSLFPERPPLEFNIDSFIMSPRTGNRFFYVLVDTIRPNIYMLKDPDSDDVIGDTTKTTLLNAASWE